MDIDEHPPKFSFEDVVGMVWHQQQLFWKSLETWRASIVSEIKTGILIKGKTSHVAKIPLKFKATLSNFGLSDIRNDLIDYFNKNGCHLTGWKPDGQYELWEFTLSNTSISPYHSFLPVSYALDDVAEDIILDITTQIKRNVSMGFHQCMCIVPKIPKDHRHSWDMVIDRVIELARKDRDFVLKKVPNQQFKLYWDFNTNSDVAVDTISQPSVKQDQTEF